jgi:hypothetical protein
MSGLVRDVPFFNTTHTKEVLLCFNVESFLRRVGGVGWALRGVGSRRRRGRESCKIGLGEGKMGVDWKKHQKAAS